MTETPITQADRDLLKQLLEVDDELGERIDNGLAFTDEALSIARHVAAERAEIAKLREALEAARGNLINISIGAVSGDTKAQLRQASDRAQQRIDAALAPEEAKP